MTAAMGGGKKGMDASVAHGGAEALGDGDVLGQR